MSVYKQVFTLKDLFANKKLMSKLPYIQFRSYRFKNGSGKGDIQTNVKQVNTLVFQTAEMYARPHFTELSALKNGNTLTLEGNIKTDERTCVMAVKMGLEGIKQTLSFTANNANIIREAMKEAEKTHFATGGNQKLYLKVSSLQEVENMNKNQLNKLMQDVMENIYYGDDYVETQKKYGIWEMKGFKKNYDERQDEWRRKVGID